MLNQKRGHVFEEVQRTGTPIFNLKVRLFPVSQLPVLMALNLKYMLEVHALCRPIHMVFRQQIVCPQRFRP